MKKQERNKLAYVWPCVTLTVPGFNPVTVDVSALPEEVQQYAALFGVGNRLHNATAGKSGAEAYAAVLQVADQLPHGWKRQAAGGGQGGIPRRFIVAAVAVLKGRPIAEVQAAAAAWTKEQWTALAASGKVKEAALEAMRKEALAAIRDEDSDILDELEL